MAAPGFPSEEARLELYRRGLNDHEIARALNMKRNSVTVWRRTRRLPVQEAQLTRRPLTAAQAAMRMLLYQLGWSDYHIAREMGVDRTAVRGWRRTKKLPANFRRAVTEASQPKPTMQSVVKRIRKAVGTSLAQDIAEDIVSDMTLAVLEGSLPLASIEAEARKYGNRVLDQFASKFGPRSLDLEIGDGNGFTLLDTLVDERSSSWLEEKGATAW